jgi:putative phosphoesterase
VRIGVVSDTHLPRFGRVLPRALTEDLRARNVELILHAGDFTGAHVPPLLESIAPLRAVAGNNDGPELVARFGRRAIVAIEGVRIGLTHGDLGSGRTTPERATLTFARHEVDAIVFGHSHVPLVDRLPDGRWLVNPGSPTDKRRQPRYSWAEIELVDGRLAPALHFFDDRSP